MEANSKIIVSVVVPFLNEEDNIPALCRAMSEYFATFNYPAEVVFVDDGSTDNSVALLKAIKHQNYKARLLTLSKNFGSLNALYAGISATSGDYTTFMYADLQDPLSLIGQMYAKINEPNDIVWAQRKTVDVDKSRFFSKLYAKLMKRYAVKDFPENGYDVVMFNGKVKQQITSNFESNSSIFLQILSLGYKQTYVLYDKQSRKAGKSKWTLSKKIKLVIDSFVSYSYLPIRIVTVTGVIFALLGFLYGVFIVCYKLMGGEIVQGWATLIVILMIGFGVTNISLGIIAEYLWRTLDVARKRPVFIIDETTEL